MINELIGQLLPIIFIVVGCIIFMVVKNKIKGNKWNHTDKDSSDKM